MQITYNGGQSGKKHWGKPKDTPLTKKLRKDSAEAVAAAKSSAKQSGPEAEQDLGSALPLEEPMKQVEEPVIQQQEAEELPPVVDALADCASPVEAAIPEVYTEQQPALETDSVTEIVADIGDPFEQTECDDGEVTAIADEHAEDAPEPYEVPERKVRNPKLARQRNKVLSGDEVEVVDGGKASALYIVLLLFGIVGSFFVGLFACDVIKQMISSFLGGA